MARKLIESMKAEWNPDAFKDDYEKALKALIARKLSGKKIKAPPKETATRPSNVIDLVDILRQSLNQKGGSSRSAKASKASGKRREEGSKSVPSSGKRRRLRAFCSGRCGKWRFAV